MLDLNDPVGSTLRLPLWHMSLTTWPTMPQPVVIEGQNENRYRRESMSLRRRSVFCPTRFAPIRVRSDASGSDVRLVAAFA
eukprot:1144940-Pelagomonas_calceolata.AAC.6